jgi:hypothetical protein
MIIICQYLISIQNNLKTSVSRSRCVLKTSLPGGASGRGVQSRFSSSEARGDAVLVAVGGQGSMVFLWDFIVATRLRKQVNTGKHTTNHGTSPCFMDRSIISIAIFNSYVGLPERNGGTGTDSKNDLPNVSQIW